MLTQTPLSTRIDNDILLALNRFCKSRKLARNKVINDALAKYLATTRD